MNKITLVAALILISSSVFAVGDIGVGLMLGQPTGFTAKKVLANGQMVDAGAGWSIGGNANFQIHSDYLWNKHDALYWDENPLDVYAGVGGRMKFADDIEFGLRIPIGFAYYVSDRQFEFFSELAPIFDFLPDSQWEAHLLIGSRYYF